VSALRNGALEMLGHATIKTTSRYTEVSLRRIQQTVSLLDRLPPINIEGKGKP
jgi:hypothetical protein